MLSIDWFRPRWAPALTTPIVLLAAGRAVNPATGQRQLALISEAQEVQIGREAAADIRTSIGLVDDGALQSYVQQIGRSEAAVSERPNLPWEFHVVDDPTTAGRRATRTCSASSRSGSTSCSSRAR